MLAFEWGPPGRGRVLLFAADAQVGNWLSWRDQQYGDGDKLKADDLLRGSCSTRSAITAATTPRCGAIRATSPARIRIGAPFGLELMNDIIALIPVDADAARKNMPDPWKMPHEPLYRRLREKARRRVLRSDLELDAARSRARR